MASHSEGGWLTSAGRDGTVNFYVARETLSSGVVRTTTRKEMKTGWRWCWGIATVGITELTGLSSDYLTYTYSYEGRELGANENDAADKAYEIGCERLQQGKYEEAKQWLDIAYQTCQNGYSREDLFRDKRDTAREKVEEEQREKARKEREEEAKRTEQEIQRSKAEKLEQRQRVAKQWRSCKVKAACQEDFRKKCEDRALHRRDKHAVLFCSAEAYQKQSQMEVSEIPDSIEFMEVQGPRNKNSDDEEISEPVVDENNVVEATILDNIKEIDLQIESLLDFLVKSNDKGISDFQQQAFFMIIYRLLDSVDPTDIDLVSLLNAIFNIVKMNKMKIQDFFSVATLIISSSRLQKMICVSVVDHSLLNELKSTWLHQMLTMKNIEHNESDLKKFLNVATKFDFNFFVMATQKLLRFYTKFSDLLDFFVKIQKSPITNRAKQHFVQSFPDGSGPLDLLAESVIDCYFCRKFSNYPSQLCKELQTLELDTSSVINFKAVAVASDVEEDQVSKLFKIMCTRFTSHWNFSYVDQELGLIEKAGDIDAMLTIFHHVYDFQGSPQLFKNDEVSQIIADCKKNTTSCVEQKVGKVAEIDRIKKYKRTKWTKQVHDLLIERAFPEAEYSLNDELAKFDVFAQLHRYNFDRFQTYMKSARTTVLPENLWIDKLSKSDIKKWSEAVLSDPSKVDLYEIIAVVNHAVKLHSDSGHSPRDVQIMALLLLLDKIEGKEGGRLLQVNTGEGKTLIVAMFAAIMTLKNHVVDVVTSSPELAKPQCEKMAPFFQDYFGQTASYVTPDCTDNTRKSAYKANIIYGAAEEFQGDILRDEYSQLGTRSGRKFDIAVVDEVDSMLIDGRNHLVMLSAPVPGMENLEVVLATIWNHIAMIESHLIERNGRVYLVDRSNRINEDGSMKPDDECIDGASPIENSKLEFIKQQTERFMRMMLRDDEHLDSEAMEMSKGYPEMLIPHHLRDFVLNVQLPKWIESALFAKYAYKNNQHYIIRNGNIAPVDASNTGIVQSNMHISNGIHQFLQIKHGAKLSPETYTTNYISNVAFFKRYGPQLVGLTGTLGSESEQALLRKMYGVDTVILPPFRRKQYRQLRPLFAKNKDQWYLTITESCIRKLEMGRAVLVIAQYLSEVDNFHKFLVEQGVKESKIHLYKTEENSDVVQKELKSGEIVIATNIAGRGTDISVSTDVEKNGGLHVCLTSLPVNERVEVQNFGRTSRTGNRGTGQFVLYEDADSTLEEIKKSRDEIEKKRLLEGEAEIGKVLIKDKIFVQFCGLLKHIRSTFATQGRLQCENNARAVEERFGLWLKEHEDKLENENEFQPFCELIRQELESDTFIKNPYFYVLNANLELDQKQYELAINKYTRAVQLDDRFMSNAFYSRGYCKIVLCSKNSNKDLAKEAVEDFRKAKEIIEGRLERDLFVIQQSAPASEALSEQVQHMLTLFTMQKSAIECAIGKGKDFVNAETERLEKAAENVGDAEDVKKYIEELEANKVRHQEGVIGEALHNNVSFNVVLNSIESSLPAGEILSLYENEIDTFRNNGHLGSFMIELINPIQWGSVICLALIGIGQMLAGAAIGIFSVGAGASVGFGMLVEGVTDLISCVVDGIINRDFSWAAWGVQKVVSYSVSIACAGLSALKDAAKVAYQGVKQTANVVAKGMTTTVKAGWKLAATKMGFELGKGVGRRLIVGVADYSLNCTLMPLVESKIKDIVNDPLTVMIADNKDVDELIKIDASKRKAYYQEQIIQKALEILHPESQTNNVAMGLVRGLQQIGENVASKRSEGISEAIMFVKIVKALYDLSEDFDKFMEAMKTEISSIASKHRSMEEKQPTPQKIDAIEEQVKLEAVEPSDGQLLEKLIQAVATHMCNIIRGSVLLPLLSYAAYKGVDTLTAEVSRSLDESMNVFKSQRRLIMLQDADKDGMMDRKQKQGIRNPVAAAKAVQVVNQLENGGEAGLPMLGAVSDTIDRPITVLDNDGNVMMYIGENKPGEAVYVQYNEATENSPGHWSGPSNTEPGRVGESTNNCLFDVVAHQTNINPDELRNDVCVTLRTDKHLNLLASGASDMVNLENSKEKYLLYGGLRRDNQGRVQEEYKGELKDVADQLTEKVLRNHGDPQYKDDTKTDTIAVGLTDKGEVLVAVNAKERVDGGENPEKGSTYPKDAESGEKNAPTFKSFGFHSPELVEKTSSEIMNTSINNIEGVPVRMVEEAELSGKTVIEKKSEHHRKHAEMKIMKQAYQDLAKVESMGVNKGACAPCHEYLTNNEVVVTPTESSNQRPRNWKRPNEFQVREVDSFTTAGKKQKE